ncbi:MGDG synthase family glycosyltransferase [Anaerosalibacter massiliensis]|uniref:MGDG synthase family glycosyltransferase n=1 Tax=Anaerosalibacter massiliensis TaxID=1347392 RepID=UPI0005B2C21C|nr:glycosyltransferase [Anaerosalibacter massiliensis]
MKKVLIFTSSIGGGHNEAASCLEKEFVKHGFIAKKRDALWEVNRKLESVIFHSYKILIDKFPKVYGNLYDISNKRKTNKLMTELVLKISKNKIYNIILEEKPDLIISTHCFVIGAIGYLKEEGLIDIPFISVVTDFQAHQTYINKNVDAYIVSSDHIKESLARHGISRDKIFSYGIPIKNEFLNRTDKKPIKKKAFQILLMAGSLGHKDMKKVLKGITNINDNYRIVVVCGNNEKLRESIQKDYANLIQRQKIILYGFTRNIPDIMESSDIIITKPGGLTVSEAIAKKLPIVVPYYIPGHEKENLDFLIKSGLAIYVDGIDNLKELIKSIMRDPKKLDNIKKNMEKACNGFCPDNIVYLGENLIEDFNYGMVFSNGF